MKTSKIVAMLVAGGMALLTSCESDRDSNPTLLEPETFVLNQPAYSGEAIDLANTSSVRFTCSQPEFGYTAAVTYKVQVSATGSFTVSADEAEEGVKPDYAEPDDAFTSCVIDVNPQQMAKAIQQVTLTPEEEIPAETEIFVRLMAKVGNFSCPSNVIKMKVSPYYVELKVAAPEVWYLVGAVIADGKWTNSSAAIGTSMIPMFTKKDAEYDKKDGKGVIVYTGYIADGKFKIVRTPGDWDHYVCCAGSWNGDTYTPFVRNGDADPGDIHLGAAGYYTITIDTKAAKCTIQKADLKDVKVYPMMGLPGTYPGADWTPANNPMTAVETVEGTENHIWVKDVTLEDGNEFKFSNGTDWWGGVDFPWGYAGADSNIPTKKGTYKVFFNDLAKAYYFHEVITE